MTTAESLAGIIHLTEQGLEHQDQATILQACIDVIGLQAQIEALAATVFAAANDRHAHEAAGQRSIGLALASQTNLGQSKCSRIVNRASVLVGLLPKVHAAYEAGQINSDQVQSIVRIAEKPGFAEAAVRDQDAFLGWAGLEWAEFRSHLDAWETLNDPVDPFELADKAYTKRSFSKMQGLDGVTLLTIDMPDEVYAQLNAAMSPIEEALWDADWNETKEAFGEDATWSQVERTTTQRRFDAFAQILRRGFSSGETDPGVQTIVNIVMDRVTFERELALRSGEAPKPVRIGDAEDYRCETLQGDPVSPRFAFDSAVAGEVRRIVIDSKSLDITVGERVRLFTGLKRLALMIRDRRCRTRGCETKAHLCEADHIREHSEGGETLVTNGQMLCRSCYRHKTRLQTQGLWQLAA